MMGKLALFALMMFGFGWAMIPLYNAICEVTGINILTKRDESAEVVRARAPRSTPRARCVIEFDAEHPRPVAVQARGRARSRSIRANSPRWNTNWCNTADQPMAGQAIPSYAPETGGRHFRKLECFCFQQQTLEGNEIRRFPVVFVIDPKLPEK